MNSGVGSRLFFKIGRSLGFEQLRPQAVLSCSRINGFSQFGTSSSLLRSRFCESNFEEGAARARCVGVTSFKGAPGQSNRSTLLGATRGLSSRQQQRLYSSEGRRWIMKHHFKGMPTMQVVLLVRLFSNVCF